MLSDCIYMLCYVIFKNLIFTCMFLKNLGHLENIFWNFLKLNFLSKCEFLCHFLSRTKRNIFKDWARSRQSPQFVVMCVFKGSARSRSTLYLPLLYTRPSVSPRTMYDTTLMHQQIWPAKQGDFRSARSRWRTRRQIGVRRKRAAQG